MTEVEKSGQVCHHKQLVARGDDGKIKEALGAVVKSVA